MSFPFFPNFRKLVPEDRDLYLSTYKRVEPYSDFSFNNLIMWLDLRGDLEVSQYKQCIVFKFSHPFERNVMAYSIIGKENCLEAVNAVFAFQIAHGEEARLTMVPECVVSDMLQTTLLPQHLVISASIDHRDYLFDTDTIAKLEGPQFKNLRHNLRAVEIEYPDIQVGTLDLGTKVVQDHLMQSLREWRADKTFLKNDPLFDEGAALKRHMKFSEWCPAECLGFFVDGKLVGFSITHIPPQQDWAIFNHLKCSRDIRFGFDYIFYTTVMRLRERGIKTVNGEQDLGIPGLRSHKQQLGPKGFLYRYDISQL